MGANSCFDSNNGRVDRNVLTLCFEGDLFLNANANLVLSTVSHGTTVCQVGTLLRKRPILVSADGSESHLYLLFERGSEHPSNVAPQNPTDAQWPRNRRVTILEYEKVSIS